MREKIAKGKESALLSMTGFGSRESKILNLGTISVEIRSINHKGQETVIHLPEGLLSLEHKIKKEIEARIERGRMTFTLSLINYHPNKIFINSELIKEYVSALKNVKKQFMIEDGLNINTLVQLPGVLSLVENKVSAQQIWPNLKKVINLALEDLVGMRRKEGRVLSNFLKEKTLNLNAHLEIVKTRFKKAINEKVAEIKTDEERSSFLKNSDITEEIERLTFHIRNFKDKLIKAGAVGKELDFIAQEMQREANTMAAKSFDMIISERVIQIKSQIEKIREQVQNIE